eukprot:c13863_g1_i1.p1 GENE.c13863_g1_i1~~c13863_g1_i1.p1  ORF type:complete len:223 (+),score=21.85 c13863_g1_i1:344-1012(+)
MNWVPTNNSPIGTSPGTNSPGSTKGRATRHFECSRVRVEMCSVSLRASKFSETLRFPSGSCTCRRPPEAATGSIHHLLMWGSDEPLQIPMENLTLTDDNIVTDINVLADLKPYIALCPVFFLKAAMDPTDLRGSEDPDCVELLRFLYDLVGSADLDTAHRSSKAIELLLDFECPPIGSLTPSVTSFVRGILEECLQQCSLDDDRLVRKLLGKLSAAATVPLQ